MRDPCQPTDYLSVQLEFLNPKHKNYFNYRKIDWRFGRVVFVPNYITKSLITKIALLF